MDGIVIALIGAGATVLASVLTLVGVIFSNKKANSKINSDVQRQLETAQAVTDTKLEELTREVREHNGFARRMPVVEEQIKVANHRLGDLEKEVHEMRHERG